MFIAYFVAGPLQANCYVLAPDDGSSAVAVDVGMDAAESVEKALAEHHLDLAGVLLTHGHIDHCAQAAALADAHDAPVWIHEADRVLLSHPEAALDPQMASQLIQLAGMENAREPEHVECYRPGADVELAGLRFSVTPAPGHTPGSVLLGVNTGQADVVLSGDVLFAGSIGRSDMPGGDDATMRTTLRDTVLGIPAQTNILPGHGQFTTMSAELTHNPYLTTTYLEAQI